MVMVSIDNKRNVEIREIIAIIRIIFIFLLLTSIYSYIPLPSDDPIYNVTCVMIFFILIVIIIYKSWGYLINTSTQTLEVNRKDVLFLVFEILLLTFVIYSTGAEESRYKNLYFISIIIASIRFGSNMGLFASTLSAVGIVFNDLINLMHLSENTYLEADIIIVIIFFVTGWMLGTFMENEIKYRKQLSERANTDEVTGLYNHRYFQERLNIEIEKAKKGNYKIALIMIDLDYFKFYNDTFGHQQGDVLLKEIGEVIKGCITDKGIMCRYGGDEFAIILKDIEADEASQVAETIRKSISGKMYFGEDSLPNSNITISVGIALYPENAMDKDELIKKADDAMYKAKFMSKNRVELYFSVLDDLKASLDESEQNLLNSIKTLITVINAKDKYTYGHSERVVIYATAIAEAMGVDEQQIKMLRYGAYLHDIGKIEISRDVLNKESKLTEDEWQILKNHPVWGADIVKPIQALHESIPVILHHHERFDGRGYPDGLKGYDIPLCARILAVADSFDAMVTDRPYKKHKSFEEAVEELKRCSGYQFDPDIVESFVKVLNNNRNLIGS